MRKLIVCDGAVAVCARWRGGAAWLRGGRGCRRGWRRQQAAPWHALATAGLGWARLKLRPPRRRPSRRGTHNTPASKRRNRLRISLSELDAVSSSAGGPSAVTLMAGADTSRGAAVRARCGGGAHAGHGLAWLRQPAARPPHHAHQLPARPGPSHAAPGTPHKRHPSAPHPQTPAPPRCAPPRWT